MVNIDKALLRWIATLSAALVLAGCSCGEGGGKKRPGGSGTGGIGGAGGAGGTTGGGGAGGSGGDGGSDGTGGSAGHGGAGGEGGSGGSGEKLEWLGFDSPALELPLHGLRETRIRIDRAIVGDEAVPVMIRGALPAGVRIVDPADPSTAIESFKIPPQKEEATVLFHSHALPTALDTPMEIAFEGRSNDLEDVTILEMQIVPWVTSKENEGPGSLRDVIESAYSLADNPAIRFAPWVFSPAEAPHLIQLEAPIHLPEDISIFGPESEGPPLVEILSDGAGRLFELGVAGREPLETSILLRNLVLGDGRADEGGCLLNHASLRIERAELRGCSASGSGGAIYGTPDSRASLHHTFISHNKASSFGGAIHSERALVWLYHSTLEWNEARHAGGAIHVDRGFLDIRHSTFRHNKTTGDFGTGGAISISESMAPHVGNFIDRAFFSRNRATVGGAIYVAGPLAVGQSAIVYNIADQGGGLAFVASGRRHSVANSTLYGNQALTAGGIFIHDSDLALVHATIVENEAVIHPDEYRSGEAGGVFAFDGAKLEMAATILADNIAEGDYAPDLYVDGSSFDSRGYNLFGDLKDSGVSLLMVPSDRWGDSTTGSTLPPQLGFESADDIRFALPPLPSSVALDRIDPERCWEIDFTMTDQRGVLRPQGTGCEIGAIEVEVD